MEIIPMRDLKDTVKIEKLCKEEGKVFVTKNGYGRLVVMDINYYKNIYEELEEAKAIYSGLKQLKEGNNEAGPVVMQQMKEKYGL